MVRVKLRPDWKDNPRVLELLRELTAWTRFLALQARCDACGHQWRWHTRGGMCAGPDGASECYCVMMRV